MAIAILDPFSGIAGDMTLGALVDCGLDSEWLRALPRELGLPDVRVRVQDVLRGQIACKKVDFDIPPQPHGRHIREIRELVARSSAPDDVRAKADAAFTAIATVEGAIHGVSPDAVHLHEVGAVDAILDVVGSIWGFTQLGVSAIYCGPIALGDGTVEAAHGTLPVPAPATLRLLEGQAVRPGPAGSGELVTPTGAALVRVLSRGSVPSLFVPRRSGYGAGTKDFRGRANALRLILADGVETPATGGVHTVAVESLVVLATDIDDMTGEYLADAADALRRAGALDVVLISTMMKKGRPGVRLEVLARPADADRLQALLFASTSTIGVRRLAVERRALPRGEGSVSVLGHRVAVKAATQPDGSVRAKPEYEDVRRVAEATGRSVEDIFALAAQAAHSQQHPAESPRRDAAGVPPGAEPPDITDHLVRTRSQV